MKANSEDRTAEGFRLSLEMLDGIMSRAKNPRLVWAVFIGVMIRGESVNGVCSRNSAHENDGRRILARIRAAMEKAKVRIAKADNIRLDSRLSSPHHD